MMDLGKRAETEAEAWARRMHGYLQGWSGPIESSWPGRLEEARLLARRLHDEPATIDGLAQRIQDHAREVWVKIARAS